MGDLLATQLRAIETLQKSKEGIEEMVKIISSSFSKSGAEYTLLNASLRELVTTCILYGDVKSTHESFLKDDQRNAQKEG